MATRSVLVDGSRVTFFGPLRPRFADLLSEPALALLVALHRRFEAERRLLLQARQERQRALDRGVLPAFLDETRHVRDTHWRCAETPADLLDRRVEITGPVSRKMVINALNSGARVFMADFEDATSPTWTNVMDGQVNLYDAVRRRIEFTTGNGKQYRLVADPAVLMVRPRGLHMEESHLWIDGKPVSASFFDFTIYFYHNAQEALNRGSGPYYYIPKLEGHLEARLWNSIFYFAEAQLGLSNVIRATVLIETILAAFEMDEILYELRDHSAGLNCGTTPTRFPRRWDYIFSVIKKFIKHPHFVLGDRKDVTMTAPFMDAYVRLLIKTCHRRGVHAMGGMAAQIPIKNDPEAHKAAMTKVLADKLREVTAGTFFLLIFALLKFVGHDGTWVAHPGLIADVLAMWNEHMPGPNQIASKKRADVVVSERELLDVPRNAITEAGVRLNCYVALSYLHAWLLGEGCVPIHHVMEDLATVEISRSQLYQWIFHHARLDSGKKVTRKFVVDILNEEYHTLKVAENAKIAKAAAANNGSVLASDEALTTARNLLEKMLDGPFEEFLSLRAYPLICHRPALGKL